MHVTMYASNYRNKNARLSPEELFAETFAHWFVGRKLPKALQDGLDKTLSNLVKT